MYFGGFSISFIPKLLNCSLNPSTHTHTHTQASTYIYSVKSRLERAETLILKLFLNYLKNKKENILKNKIY